ncbi:TonB-dependent receptor [candidate division KSB1 bacterium]|nr:TonB-dependent receptor [candidate division KSB1 bacterium]
MRYSFTTLLITALLLGFCLSGIIQAGTVGKISGRITDEETGDVLPMANVVIVGTTMGASSDLNGYYAILQVPPGTYKVKATMMGYKNTTMTEVKVAVDLTTTLNIRMSPTVMDLGEEVTIVAERPLVQKDITSSVHHISHETIKDMPSVSGVKDLVAQQAGVVGEGMHINIRGGRTGETLTVVDGLAVRDPLFRQATRSTQEQVMDFSSNPVDELTGRTGGLAIPANAIAEVEVITGGFDAEYGKAMSGIVNIVTREGGKKFSGSLMYMTDDLGQGSFKTIEGDGTGLRKYSQNSDRFEMSLSGPEPITSTLLPMLGVKLPVRSISYFIAAQGEFTDVSGAYDIGYYAPTSEVKPTRDKMFGVKLPFEFGNRMDNQYNSISKLTVRFTPNHKLSMSYSNMFTWYEEYNHAFSLIPENFYQRREQNENAQAIWNHTLSPTTYYEVSLGYIHTNYLLTPGGMLPPDVYNLWDSLQGKLGDDRGRSTVDDDGDGFYEAGYPDRGTYHERYVQEVNLKFDIVSQIHRNHQIKTGVDASYYKMMKAEIKYPGRLYPGRKIDDGPWPELGIFRDFYTRFPTTFSAYIQDKIEYETLIVRVGLRWDIWVPGKHVNEMVEGENTVPGTDNLKFKHNFNPRLGISHPITDRDVLYFQFGKFSQEVDWQFLYMQDTQSSGAYKLYGNPNLSSEETTQYEVGVNHAFPGEILKIKLTAFYKDYSGLINAEQRGTFETYSVYVNRDYGSARGFEVAFDKRYSHYTSGRINYTYQYAMGKSSSYRQGYDYGYRGAPIPIREWPLDWDIRHSANIGFNFRIPKGKAPLIFGRKFPMDDWGAYFVWRLESGKPYTPSGLAATQFTTHNSARTPYRSWLNIRFTKDFRLNLGITNLSTSFIVELNNVLNRRNIRATNTETGDALGFMREQDINPSAYGVGRNIHFGLRLEM